MYTQKIREQFLPMSETMFYILLTLQQERHGYGIMLDVDELTRGRIHLGASTIYQTLAKLDKGGLIKPTGELERQKRYLITGLGRDILHEEARRIRQMCADMEGLL